MNFSELTSGNYMMFALLHYDNPHCQDIKEFFEDIKDSIIFVDYLKDIVKIKY